MGAVGHYHYSKFQSFILGSVTSFSCFPVHWVANQHVKQQHWRVQSARSINIQQWPAKRFPKRHAGGGWETNMQQLVALNLHDDWQPFSEMGQLTSSYAYDFTCIQSADVTWPVRPPVTTMWWHIKLHYPAWTLVMYPQYRWLAFSCRTMTHGQKLNAICTVNCIA